MTIAIVLIAASALAGTATGYIFRIWALIIISPLIAIVSAIILRVYEFGMLAGVTVIALCLVASQLAYLAKSYLRHARHVSAHDELDGDPGKISEHKIRRQHE